MLKLTDQSLDTGLSSLSDKSWNYPRGLLCHGDCLEFCKTIQPEQIRLIVVDPPFGTGRDQTGSSGELNYPDPDYQHPEEYTLWLMERLQAMWPLLRLDGSLVVHLDWRTVHHVKVALDKFCGHECFQNELIWHYQTGGASKRRFARKHDTLLWYTRHPKDWVFRPERIRIPRSEKALHRARNPRGARISVHDHWKYPEDILRIPQLNPMARERTGYPTQKPTELLLRLITAMSDPGEIVADFFCGSGTLPIAAELSKRRWLASDISMDAIRITQQRLHSLEDLAHQAEKSSTSDPDQFPA